MPAKLRLLQRGQRTSLRARLGGADLAGREALLGQARSHAMWWAGDKALQAAAQVLATTFREEDAVARLGGDEFAVFTDHAATRAPPGILHRLQQRLDERNRASGDPWTVAFSLGTHVIEPGAPVSVEEALAAADRAPYAAQRQRRG